MAITAPVLNIVPGVMSLALLGESTKMLPKQDWDIKTSKKDLRKRNKAQMDNIISGFVKISVGIPLIGATSGMIARV